MDFKKLSAPLSIDQIDFRIQSINLGGYATILAYKDARVDMQRLDEVCGPLNWMRNHTRDNKNCTISIWDDGKKQWVGKEDTGVESNTEKEKGLASDSFKRAGFNWGIGRELYDYPLIQVKLNSNEFEKKKDKNDKDKAYATWELRLREWEWLSRFKENNLVFLQATDNRGIVRFTWSSEPKPKNNIEPTKTFDDYELEIEAAAEEGTLTVEWWKKFIVQATIDYPDKIKDLIQLKDVLKEKKK